MEGQCEWKQWEYEGDTWEGGCGAAWSFIEGGPQENEMNYCPNCGKTVKVIPKVLPEDEDE
jgi:hypothetical protein